MIQDFAAILSPISKIKLYRRVRKLIFAEMDKDKIPPQRANEVLEYVKKYVVDIETTQLAKKFIHHLGEKFPELQKMEQKFELEESEKIDDFFSLFLDQFIQGGEIDLSVKVMERWKSSEDPKQDLLRFKTQYPKEFMQAEHEKGLRIQDSEEKSSTR